MPNLGACATPIVLELGVKDTRKTPRSCRQRPRLDPRIPSSEIKAAPPVATLLMAYASPSVRGRGRKPEPQMVTVYRSSRRVLSVLIDRQLFPASANPYDTARTLPLYVIYVAKGLPIRAVCFRDNPSAPHEALLSLVGTNKRRDWVGKPDRGSDLKDIGNGRFSQNPP
jgi:hypothetical protein